MAGPLHDVCLAAIPPGELAALAEVRCVPGVVVAAGAERTWVRWEAGTEAVLRRLLVVPGARLYACRDGLWYCPGRHLPAFEVPENLDYRPLHQALAPARFEAVPPPVSEWTAVPLSLVPDPRRRPTTAAACDLAELEHWADTVPTRRLASIRGVHCGGRMLLWGTGLPLLPGTERFWGERVLVPLGRRVEPELPESVLREALGLGGDELLVLCAGRADVIRRELLTPLTRAGIRLAGRDGRP